MFANRIWEQAVPVMELNERLTPRCHCITPAHRFALLCQIKRSRMAGKASALILIQYLVEGNNYSVCVIVLLYQLSWSTAYPMELSWQPSPCMQLLSYEIESGAGRSFTASNPSPDSLVKVEVEPTPVYNNKSIGTCNRTQWQLGVYVRGN